MVSADYIVGLTDGEGCFYVNVRTRNSRWTPKVETHFYIKLREDNRQLLEKVKEKFGRGAVYFQKDRRPNHSSCYRFEINSQKDIKEVLIPFFKKHSLQGPKRKDFEIFCLIAKLVQKGKHKTDKGLEKIRNLKMQMNIGLAGCGRSARPVGTGINL